MKDNIGHLRLVVPATLLALATACASTPEIDPRQLQQAEIAIDEAKEVNAGRHAAGTLARAEERLAMAKEAIDDGDEQKARFMVNEAIVLADLAEARALERDSELALKQIRDNLGALREQLQTPAGG